MLTLLEGADAGATWPRGLLKVGPATVARHQLSLALAMDCQRVVCLATGVSPEILALQHAAEEAGAKFHLIKDAWSLSGLISASDEVLVINDGLLVSVESGTAQLERGHCVLVLPIDAALAAGFERIDLVHGDAGLLRLPGRLIESLLDLPSDCSVYSSLLRIALQAGICRREVPLEAREGGRWLIIHDEEQAHAVELDWINLQLSRETGLSPVDMLGRGAVRMFGPALLHAGSSGNALAAGAAVFALMALGSGWFGLTAGALVVLALAYAFRRFAAQIITIEQATLRRSGRSFPREMVFGWLHDLVLVAILTWARGGEQSEPLHERIFAPLLLVCLLHIVPKLMSSRWASWLSDRGLINLLLAAAVIAGYAEHSVMLVVAALALIGAFYPGKRTA